MGIVSQLNFGFNLRFVVNFITSVCWPSWDSDVFLMNVSEIPWKMMGC